MGNAVCRGVGCMRKFLIVPVFVIFLLTGYFTVSRVTTCQAQCTCATFLCIMPGPGMSIASALWENFLDVTELDTEEAQQFLEVYFQPLVIEFWYGMQPVLQWSFQKQIPDWFNTFWYYNLLPAMQQMTKELSTADVEQTFALGMFSDAVNMIRNQGRTVGGGPVASDAIPGDGYGGDMGIKDHREQRPSGEVCTGGSIMSGLERANAFSDAYQAFGSMDKWWIAANQWGSEAQYSFAAYMDDRWRNDAQSASVFSNPSTTGTYGYVPNWCNVAYNKGYAGCAQDGRWAGEDVDVAGMVFAQDTIPLDPTQDSGPRRVKGDLDELVTNLAEAFGKDPVTAGQAGKDGILASLSYRTKRQVVYDSLYYVISRRVPGGLRADSKGPPQMPALTDNGVGLPDLLKQIRAETGEDATTGCGTGLAGQPCTSPNPSRNEMLRAMITQQFQSGKYALRQIDEPENNQREQVIEQALQLIQMSDQLDLMDHYSLLLSSQISNEIVHGKMFTSASGGAPMQ